VLRFKRHTSMLICFAWLISSFISIAVLSLSPIAGLIFATVCGFTLGLYSWVGDQYFHKLSEHRSFVFTPLNFCVFLLGLHVISFGLASMHGRRNLIGLGQFLVSVTWYFIIFLNLNSRRRIRQFMRFFIITGGIAAISTPFVMSAVHVKFMPFIINSLELQSGYSLNINPNYIGGTLLFFFPLTFWLVKLKEDPFRKIAIGVATVLIFSLVYTQSRGAILSIMIAMIIGGVFLNRIDRRLALVFSLSLILIVPLAYVGFSSLGLESMSNRIEIWQKALFIAQDFPFTGIGLMNFAEVEKLLYSYSRENPIALIPHAHNQLLDVVCAIGVPGLISYTALLTVTLCMFLDILQSNELDRELRLWTLGVGGGFIAHLVYGFADVIALGEKAGFLFWSSLGLIAALSKIKQQGKSQNIRVFSTMKKRRDV
jgi:putative inorganic carbon (hco3(-)) transporter